MSAFMLTGWSEDRDGGVPKPLVEAIAASAELSGRISGECRRSEEDLASFRLGSSHILAGRWSAGKPPRAEEQDAVAVAEAFLAAGLPKSRNDPWPRNSPEASVWMSGANAVAPLARAALLYEFRKGVGPTIETLAQSVHQVTFLISGDMIASGWDRPRGADDMERRFLAQTVASRSGEMLQSCHIRVVKQVLARIARMKPDARNRWYAEQKADPSLQAPNRFRRLAPVVFGLAKVFSDSDRASLSPDVSVRHACDDMSPLLFAYGAGRLPRELAECFVDASTLWDAMRSWADDETCTGSGRAFRIPASAHVASGADPDPVRLVDLAEQILPSLEGVEEDYRRGCAAIIAMSVGRHLPLRDRSSAIHAARAVGQMLSEESPWFPAAEEHPDDRRMLHTAAARHFGEVAGAVLARLQSYGSHDPAVATGRAFRRVSAACSFGIDSVHKGVIAACGHVRMDATTPTS